MTTCDTEPDPDSDPGLTLPQVIELAGISETQIARLRKAGRFPDPASTRPNRNAPRARPVNLWTRESIVAWRRTRPPKQTPALAH